MKRLALLLFSLLAACSTFSTSPKYTSSSTFDVRPKEPKGHFVHLWSKEGPGLNSFGSFPQEYAGVTHIGTSDTVVVARLSGKITRYQASSGEQLWEVRIPYNVHGTPVSRGQVIYVPTLNGFLVALSELNGEVLWTAQTTNSLEARPAVNREVVVTIDAEDVLYCWNVSDGSERWRYANERNNNFTIKGATTPILLPNSVIVGFSGGEISRFNLTTGQKEWTLDASGGQTEFADVDLILPGKNGVFYAATRAGGVLAIDETSGRVLWRTKIAGITSLDVSTSHLVVGTTTNQIIALTTHGKIAWKFTTKESSPTALTHYGPYVIAATGDGNLYLLDEKSGYPFQKWSDLMGIHSPLTFGGERVYLHTDGDDVFAFKIGWPTGQALF